MSLSERFDEFDDNLKLAPNQRDRAVAAHNNLDTVLRDAGLAKKTRLQGSFARKTMLPPLKDIDKVSELTDAVAEEFDRPGGPLEAALRSQAAVTAAYPGAMFKLKRHAIGIALPGEDFVFDAVSAINDEDTDAGIIRIANLDEDRWEESNTYVLIETIRARNVETDGTFIHDVRMVKHLFKQTGLDKIPGIHIEAFCHDGITEKMAYPDAIVAALESASVMLPGDYDDPTGIDRISDRIPLGVRLDAKAVIDRCLVIARDAQAAAAAGDETKAANLWADLLADEYPRPASSAAERSTIASMYRSNPTRPWRLS